MPSTAAATDATSSSIIVSCKQTRFHIDAPNYRELDIEGLNITVTSNPPSSSDDTTTPSTSTKGKGKVKARAGNEGLEILRDATLRLKEGRRYALVGRNGCGKSTLLKAIAEKLIPSIPEETRICILQQKDAVEGEGEGEGEGSGADADGSSSVVAGAKARARTVLEEVVDAVTLRSEAEREIQVLTTALDESADKYTPLRALRQIHHARLRHKLSLLDKDARLRSGARGFAARKTLRAFEKTVSAHEATLAEPDAAIDDTTLAAETQEAGDLLAELQAQTDPARLAVVETRARRILRGLGFAEDVVGEKTLKELSGGWRMRAALAMVLLMESDVLILDEPTNFLDMLGIVWLQRYLTSLASDDETPSDVHTDTPPTLILVSHDRAFTELCTTDTLILKDQTLTLFHGTLSAYHASLAQRTLHLSRMQAAQDRQRAHMERSIAGNLRQAKASNDDGKLRQAKSRQKRLDERWGMQTNARGGRFKLNRDLPGHHFSNRAEIDVPVGEKGVVFKFPAVGGLRFPGALVSLEGVAFRYGYSKGDNDVLKGVTVSVHLGDRIGILGLNGAGKSTLVSLLVGKTTPTRGTASFHPRLRLGYFSQDAVAGLHALGATDPSLTALSLLLGENSSTSGGADSLEGGGGSDALDQGQARALLGTLGLPGRLASDVPVARLSGGQLVRLELARILARSPQCLVLDEVTTHLDYESVAALRDALRGWEGAVVVVSHDRWFMRGVVEGSVDEDEEGSDDDDGREDVAGEETRRRVVYRIKGGELARLDGGVGQFETLMEKRVAKMMREG